MCGDHLLGLEDREEIELDEMACFNVGSITVTSVMDLDSGTDSDTLLVLCSTSDSGTLQKVVIELLFQLYSDLCHLITFITLTNTSKLDSPIQHYCLSHTNIPPQSGIWYSFNFFWVYLKE